MIQSIKPVLLFASFVPVIALWTALVVVLSPLRIISWCCQIRCIDALFREYFDLLGMIGRYFSSVNDRPGQGRPILFVHGYLHNASAWGPMMKKFEGPLYAINLEGMFQSIRTYAAQVRAKIEEISRETGRKDIAIVAHSMGGLVAALASPENVTDIITIGSPLHGTPIARWASVGPNGSEMEPESDLLPEIQEKIRQSKISYHHIASTCDEIVPAKSAVMENGDNVTYDDLGHISLLCSEKVADQIQTWLKI
jgi:triacylglycerol lipase